MNTTSPTAQGSLELWLFNAIMQEIEPELTTMIAPTLKEKYQSETPSEHAERMARYDAAFQTFDAMLPRVLAMLEEDAAIRKRDTL